MSDKRDIFTLLLVKQDELEPELLEEPLVLARLVPANTTVSHQRVRQEGDIKIKALVLTSPQT